MKRPLVVGLAIAVSVFATARALLSRSTDPLPNFAGTWRLANLDLKPTVHRHGHVHQHIAPRIVPMTMLVTQGADSVTVQIHLLDSADIVIASPGRVTYRSEWSASGNSPSGTGVRTRMKARPRDGSLELTTMTPETQRERGGESQIATTETWRIGADGTLDRRVHSVGAEGTVDRVETWRRIAPN